MPSSKRSSERQATVVSLPWYAEMVWAVLGRENGRPGDLSEAKGQTGLAPGHPEGQQADSREDVGWTAYPWQPLREGEEPRPRGVGVATSARRLMAMERSRMRRATPVGYVPRGHRER
ncbi:MAG: hypothetical protein HW388_1414 [Dehalococcoidia bacterium]|nr:hypothetical protein [Dehalococcoidia bacterium]